MNPKEAISRLINFNFMRPQHKGLEGLGQPVEVNLGNNVQNLVYTGRQAGPEKHGSIPVELILHGEAGIYNIAKGRVIYMPIVHN